MQLNLAKAYVGANQTQAAREAYVALLKLDPRQWDAAFELGKLYASTGDAANAKKTLGDLLARNPGYAKRAEAERILGGL